MTTTNVSGFTSTPSTTRRTTRPHGAPVSPSSGPIDSFRPTPDVSQPQGSPLTFPQAIVAGPTQSPQFLGNEQQFFQAYRNMIQSAQPGDILNVEMYEFQNQATNPSSPAASNSPGFADQEALLPELAAASKRGVQVNDILDGTTKKGQQVNAPIQNYLLQNGDPAHETLQIYPANTVNIDHFKGSDLLRPTGNGTYQTVEGIVSGSNLGTHTAANNDGGIALYGQDAVGLAQAYYHDAALTAGQQSPLGTQDPNSNAPIKMVTTSPTSDDILTQKMNLLNQADSAYISDFCLNQPDMVQRLAQMGPNAHVTLDPSEKSVNMATFNTLKAAGCDVKWANVAPGSLLHKKEAVYLKNGQIIGGAIGSANDTRSGLDEPYTTVGANGKKEDHKTNHEGDVIITPETNGSYSTMPALEALLASLKTDNQNGLDTPPAGAGNPDEF